MRYTAFTIKNFKGIRELELKLDSNPNSNIFIIVGLNESGKTTIMEALSFFYDNLKEKNEVALHRSVINDIHSLIPKSLKDNFTNSIKISAKITIEEKDKAQLKKTLNEHSFKCEDINSEIIISHTYKFDNSQYLGEKNNSFGIKIFGKEGGKKKKENLSQQHQAWWPVFRHCCKLLPQIIYYPNFLFDFPDFIYLEKSLNESREQEFYRRLLQDVLDSMPNNLNVDTHIVERAKSEESSVIDSLESVINKMSSKITKVVFNKDLSVFGDNKRNNKEILVTKPKKDSTNGLFYVEMKLKDGEDSYYIRERSLGFQWFFTFRIFTQFRVHRLNSEDNLIFLFDEPASNLHPAAQQRLLKAFEELTKSSVSVIYATHSHHLIDPKRLENTFIANNQALKYEEEDEDDTYNSYMTDITIEKYKKFVSNHPNQQTYYQPILDALDYRPSNLESLLDVVMLEGKNDFYVLTYFDTIINNNTNKINFLPGMGSGGLDTVIRLYYAWGKDFIILLDSDTEGKTQKERYKNLFGVVVHKRLFTLEDIQSSWSNHAIEKLFSSDDRLKIQNTINPSSSRFDKKLFHFAIQENLVKGISVTISQETQDNLKKILDFLSAKLAATKS
jgi:predicted ATP-dependent endonuclease of OLD family